jgi:hypothetical protein
MLVWWSIGAGVHVEPHSHANEQIVWMLKGKLEFRLGNELRVCGQGDVVVIPGGGHNALWLLDIRSACGECSATPKPRLPHRVKTGSALVEHKISASSPKPDICALMSTRARHDRHRRPLLDHLVGELPQQDRAITR